MKRSKFLKASLLTGAAGVAAASGVKAAIDTSKKETLEKNVGFNHLPNKENRTMNSVLHKSDSRGLANHGWLQSRHTFSFANYYNPERMNFGALRVLNDDKVAPGMGFGTHPHRDMEIISIPLEGDLKHQDDMGNSTVIKNGDIQVMSAGTGVRHSEYNKNTDQEVKFLQIWVVPNERGVSPRYDQITLNESDRKDKIQQVLSPKPEDDGVWIHQNAWFSLSTLSSDKEVEYKLNDPNLNGVYIFVLNGELDVEGQDLNSRDGYGLWNTESVSLHAKANSEVLIMEVPMS